MLNHSRILQEQARRHHKIRTRRHFLQYPGLKELVLLGCIAADAVTIFAVLDNYQTQQAWITLVITITLAACLDVPPMLLGSCLGNPNLTQKERTIQAVAMILVFLLVFGLVFALRIATVEDLFAGKEAGTLVIQTGTEVLQSEPALEEGPTTAQYLIGILMGIANLGTSVISFFLTYESTPELTYRLELKLSALALQDQIDTLKVMRQELADDKKFDLESYDADRFQTRDDLIDAEAQELKWETHLALAEEIGTPQAVSALLQDYQSNQPSPNPKLTTHFHATA